MIQIKTSNLKAIAEKHFELVSPTVIRNIDFYLGLFDAIGNSSTLPIGTNVSNHYNIGWPTIYAMIDHLLASAVRKNKNIVNVTSAQVNDIFINATRTNINHQLTAPKSKSLFDFFGNVKKEIKDILIGSPEKLFEFVAAKTFPNQKELIKKNCIEKIFSYESLISSGFVNGTETWNSYILTNALNLSVCPYCNRNWIITITDSKDGSKVVNPQLDHFLPKSDFPLFRLSFFNLIPSCDTCNTRLKRSTPFDNSYFHPYMAGYGKNANFRSIALDVESSKGDASNYSINLEYSLISEKNKSRIVKNNDIFKIKDIYEKHGDIVAELYKVRHTYSERYLEMLKDSFKDSNLSMEELYKLAFRNFYSELNFHRRPFSKLTKDIASQLKMID